MLAFVRSLERFPLYVVLCGNATSSPLVDNDHGGIASSTVLEAGEPRNDTGQRTLNGEWAVCLGHTMCQAH